MGAVWLWAGRDLVRGWRSLAVVAVVVALAGGAVLAALAGARRADSAVDRSLDRGSFYEVSAFATEPIPAAMRWLEADRRVARIDEFRVVLAAPAHLTPGLDGAMLVPADGTAFGSLWMVDGRVPDGPTELLVSELTAGRQGLEVGDRVPFHYVPFDHQEMCLQEAPPCPSLAPLGDLTVAGIFRNPSDLASANPDQGLFAAGPELLAGLGPVDQVTPARWIHVALHDRAAAGAVAADLSVRLPEGDVTNEVLVLDPARRAAGVLATGLRVAAAVAALAAVVATAQTASRHFAVHHVEMLPLAALGMTRGGRALAAALPAFGASAAAGAAAVLVAVGLSPAFPLGLARRADPDPGLHADWLVLAPGAVTVALVATAVCAHSAWRRAGVGPGRRAIAPGPSLVARWAERLGLSPVPTAGARFGLEMRRGATARTAQVLVTVALVVAVVVGSLVVRDSLATLLHRPERYGVTWDLALDLPDRAPATMAAVEQLTADRRVTAASLASTGELTVVAGPAESQVTAIGTSALAGAMSPSVLQGRAPEGLDEVMMAPTTIDELGLGVGDEIVLEGISPRGDAPPRRTVRVVGRGVMPVAVITDVDDGLLLPLQTFDALGGEGLVSDIDARSVLLLEVPESAHRAAIQAELQAAYGDLLWQSTRPVDVSILDELTPVPPVLAGFAALLGTIVTAQALTGVLRRRGGELAVMRALGLRPSQAAAVVFWQAAIIAAVAVGVGVPAGILAGRSVWRAVARGAHVIPVTDVPLAALALVAALAGVVALASGVLPARRAARLRPADALRAE